MARQGVEGRRKACLGNTRALAYPKLRARVDAKSALVLIELIRHQGQIAPDPKGEPSVKSSDPGDDYLIALGASTGAVIVSGDQHLLGLADKIPVHSPADFLPCLLTKSEQGEHLSI